MRFLSTVAVLTLLASPAFGQGEKLKVLVLDPTSSTVETAVLQTVGSLLSVELAKTRELDVITSTDVKKIAALEAEKQTMGCDEASCLAELAGALGARLVVFGDANKLGTLTVLNLNLFDSTKAQSVGRVSVQVSTLEELPGKLSPAVRELMRDALKDAQIATAPEASPMEGIWRWGLLGGGAVVGLGGIAYDAMAPSSGDDVLDGFDAIGPGLMGAGVAVIVLGLVVNPFAGDPDGT